MIEITEIAVNRIWMDSRFQPRSDGRSDLYNADEVSRMAEAGRATGHENGWDPEKYDPIGVWAAVSPDLGGEYYVLEGFHRLALAKQAGIARLPCRVHRVSEPDALRIAVRSNLKIRPHDPLEEAAVYHRLFDGGMTADEISRELDRRPAHYYEQRACLDYLTPTIRDEVQRKAIRVEYAEAIGLAARSGATPAAQGWLRDLARSTKCRVEVFRALVTGLIRRAAAADDPAAAGPSDQIWLFDVPPDELIVTAKAEMARATQALALRDGWDRVAKAVQGLLKALNRRRIDPPYEIVEAAAIARTESAAIALHLGIPDAEGDGPDGAAPDGVRGAIADAVTDGDTDVGTGGIAARPVLRRWVGGKAWILPDLLPLIRDSLTGGRGRFVEPFAGGAAITAALAPDRGVLGEAAPEIIFLYEQIKADPIAVFKCLRDLIDEAAERAAGHPGGPYDGPLTREMYLWVRDQMSLDSCRRAVRVIYLHFTCFNGLWRVNRKGLFNVPWGARERPPFPTEADLVAFGRSLANVQLRCEDFRETAKFAKYPGDVLYLDPPYPGTFESFVPPAWRFDPGEVRSAALAAAARGATVIVSNPGTAADAWSDVGEVRRLSRTHKVGGRGGRRTPNEEILVVLR